MSRYLIDEVPIVVQPSLIYAFGHTAASILQQIHFWCGVNAQKNQNFKNGFYWVYNTREQWAEQFWYLNERTVWDTLGELRKLGVVVAEALSSEARDRTLWYRLSPEKLNEIVERELEKRRKLEEEKLKKLGNASQTHHAEKALMDDAEKTLMHPAGNTLMNHAEKALMQPPIKGADGNKETDIHPDIHPDIHSDEQAEGKRVKSVLISTQARTVEKQKPTSAAASLSKMNGFQKNLFSRAGGDLETTAARDRILGEGLDLFLRLCDLKEMAAASDPTFRQWLREMPAILDAHGYDYALASIGVTLGQALEKKNMAFQHFKKVLVTPQRVEIQPPQPPPRASPNPNQGEAGTDWIDEMLAKRKALEQEEATE